MFYAIQGVYRTNVCGVEMWVEELVGAQTRSLDTAHVWLEQYQQDIDYSYMELDIIEIEDDD